MHKYHHGAQRQAGSHHARPQQQLRDVSAGRRPHHGSFEVVTRLLQLRLETGNFWIFAVDAGFERDLRAIEVCFSPFQCRCIAKRQLTPVFQIKFAERAARETSLVALEYTLATIAIGRGFHYSRSRCSDRRLEFPDALLAACQERLFLPHDGRVGFGINAKQHRAFFNGHVGFDLDFDHDPADGRNNRRGNEKFARYVGIGVVVVHQQDQRPKENSAPQSRRWHRPLGQRNLEHFEYDNTDGRVSENDQ